MQQATPLMPALRLVASMVRRHPISFAIAVSGSVLYAAGTVGVTIVLGRMIDDIVVPELDETSGVDAGNVWWGAAVVLLVVIGRAVGVVARRYYAGKTAVAVKRDLRDSLGDKYLELPMSWHRTVPTGRLLAHVDADAEVAADALHPLPFSLGVSTLAVFATVSALLVDPVLALVGLVIFPVMVAVNRWYNRYVEAPAARVQAAIGEVSAIAHESFDGALIVKTLGRSEPESERFSEAVGHLRGERVHLGTIRSAFQAVIEALPQLGIVTITVAGVYRLEAGAVTAGDVVQLVALFAVLAFPMQVFGFFLESLPPTVVAHRRIASVLDIPVLERPSESAASAEGPAGLSCRGIAAGYGAGPTVLHDVDIDIAPGETIAIVGSTGSGKSTLAGVLAGVDPPRAGAVHLDGVQLARMDPDVRIANIAFVSQEAFLFGDSIRDNIDLTGELALDKIRGAAAIAGADEFIIDFPDGYDTILGERGVTVSGGQRQRIALARAIVRRPRLLVLDDATSAVDTRVESQILDALDRELDMTMVLVAQRLSTIELADRVLFVRDGHIRAEGRHQELLDIPEYMNLVTAYALAAK